MMHRYNPVMTIRDSTSSPFPVEITLRIPGPWASIEALAAKLPLGARLDDHHLHLEDGVRAQWSLLPADEEFLEIFASSCTRMPSDRDRKVIEHYTFNLCLTMPAGSAEAAANALRAAAVILRAGGAGVFIDNSCLAHGSDDWHALANAPDDGGVFWAFVSFVRSQTDLYSIGMHVLGCRDAIMARSGEDERDRMILASFLGFSYRSGVTLEEDEILRDPSLPSYQLKGEAIQDMSQATPAYNPQGRWRLVQVELA